MELAVDVVSLSGSVVHLGVTPGPSVGCAQFEFFLTLLTAAGMEVVGVLVSVSVWDVRVALAPDGRAVHLTLSVMTGGENFGSSG